MKIATCTDCGDKFEFSEYERDEDGALRRPKSCPGCEWVW